HNMSVSDRQAILNDPALLRQLNAGADKGQALTYTAALFEGSLKWDVGIHIDNPPNDFQNWLMNNGPEPNVANGSMNCWEFVMFAAYKAEQVSRDQLANLYNDPDRDSAI